MQGGQGPARVARAVALYVEAQVEGEPDATALDQRKELYTSISTRLSQYWRVSAGHRENLARGGGSIRTDICSGGCPAVAVFQLTDGSIRAIGVGTPGVARNAMSFDWGPLQPGRAN